MKTEGNNGKAGKSLWSRSGYSPVIRVVLILFLTAPAVAIIVAALLYAFLSSAEAQVNPPAPEVNEDSIESEEEPEPPHRLEGIARDINGQPAREQELECEISPIITAEDESRETESEEEDENSEEPEVSPAHEISWTATTKLSIHGAFRLEAPVRNPENTDIEDPLPSEGRTAELSCQLDGAVITGMPSEIRTGKIETGLVITVIDAPPTPIAEWVGTSGNPEEILPTATPTPEPAIDNNLRTEINEAETLPSGTPALPLAWGQPATPTPVPTITPTPMPTAIPATPTPGPLELEGPAGPSRGTTLPTPNVVLLPTMETGEIPTFMAGTEGDEAENPNSTELPSTEEGKNVTDTGESSNADTPTLVPTISTTATTDAGAEEELAPEEFSLSWIYIAAGLIIPSGTIAAAFLVLRRIKHRREARERLEKEERIVQEEEKVSRPKLSEDREIPEGRKLPVESPESESGRQN